MIIVVVGDSKTLQYWEYKKGELQNTFTSEPFSYEVSRVVISGTADKASVFVASRSQIKGFTKRGKEFFKLDSSHTDAI